MANGCQDLRLHGLAGGILASLALVSSPGPSSGQQAESLLQRYEKAVDRWAAADPPIAYDVAGWVGESGEITGGAKGLGCSAFAAAVLCEVLHGENAFAHQRREDPARPWVHQLWGDGIARHFALGKAAYAGSVADFLALAGQAEQGSGSGLPQGLFFFDLRNERGRLGLLPGSSADIGHGHVGFLHIEGARIRQAHFSGLRTRDGTLRYNGLARDDRFAEFLRRSLYGCTAAARASSTLALYRLDG